MSAELPGDLETALADHYHIERELGRGGMATVYLARDLRHERLVALKVLRPDVGAVLGRERFTREIKLAAGLQHPHIVAVHESGCTRSGQLWFTMPYVEGLSLRDRLRQQRQLSVDEAVRITREVALALDYAHRHGVIHRDIKPENILLVDDQAMVADFGIARAIEAAAPGETLTATGMAVGTPAYMSPEQAAGERALDPATDIYSLGAVCYEMLTGEPPFPGPTAQAIAAKMRSGEVPSIRRVRPSVPEAVEEVVRKALAPVPADRFATSAAFAAALETAERAATKSSSGASASAAPPPPSSRPVRRLPAGAALLALGVCIGAGFLFAWRAHERSAGAERGPIRIAVLPFENLGASGDDYFADGMTEELTGRLGKLSGLAVIARTSAIQYKKTTKTIAQIGGELGADYLIEGTVRWEKLPSGTGRVRIAPQLVRAKDGTQVWADQYDKAYGTAIFDMQSDIAERVASSLRVTLLAPEEKAVRVVPTTNMQAYDYFLRGQAYSARDFGQDWEAERLALESYTRATHLDSNFALAYALAGATNWAMHFGGYDESLPTGVTEGQRLELVRLAAQRAVALDSSISIAHVTLALYYSERGDTTRLLEEIGRALAANPNNADAVGARGRLLSELGLRCQTDADSAGRSKDCDRKREGIRELERAVTLDPRNPSRFSRVVFYLGGMDPSTAETYADRAIVVSPDLPEPYAYKAWLELMQGRPDGARAALRDGSREAGRGRLLFALAQNSVFGRFFGILRDEYGGPAKDLTWDAFGADSLDYYQTKAEAYQADSVKGPAYFDSLARWAAPKVQPGEDHNTEIHIDWIKGLAGSGKRQAAVKEIGPLLENKQYRWEPWNYEEAAELCMMVALYDCAIREMREALAFPMVLNAALIKVDPIWDPLRGRADFQQLLERR